MKHAVIIGGGASGMAAAIAAAEGGVPVTLIEKKEQLGKKLQVTGNGHCNFTNGDLKEERYHSDDTAFLSACLKRFPTARIVSFFERLGMLSQEKNGCYYPLSGQAQTVLTVLKNRLKDLNVKILLNTDVTGIEKCEDGNFRIRAGKETILASDVVLSCGSEASVRDPRPFTAYGILKTLGLNVVPAYPSLVALYGNEGTEALWDGVRHFCRITIPGGVCETGEVQFTKKGISGIPVFQISHDAVGRIRKTGSCTVMIDLLPDHSKDEIRRLLAAQEGIRLDRVLSGWLPSKLGPAVVKKAQISASGTIGEYSEEETERLLNALKSFEYRAVSHAGMQDAQVSSGGLSLKEITEDCEVRRIGGLYVTGELLNADGICGGYNLHFAFATGLTAGSAIAGRSA